MPSVLRFRWCLALGVVALAHGEAKAADAPPPTENVLASRREAVLAVGLGTLVTFDSIAVYETDTQAAAVSTLTGWNIEVTYRALPVLELGASMWTTGGSSNGGGSNASVLSRWTAQARLFARPFGRVEPWVGAEIGLALADDYAIWNKTEAERRHVVTVTRPGFASGLQAGARVRLSDFFAVNLRGGAFYLDVQRAYGPVLEAPDLPKYAVRPTDYANRMWLSVVVCAELTVAE